MKELIFIVPGILTDIKESHFSDLTRMSDDKFDVVIHDILSNLNKASDLQSIVSSFESSINQLSLRYEKIYLITHSSGSEIALRSKLNASVKQLIFWSPAMFYPQNVMNTLKASPSDEEMLVFNKDITIGQRLAKDLDDSDTLPLIKKNNLPTLVYLSREDAGHNVWQNYVEIPFRHNYTKNELCEMLDMTKKYLTGTNV